MEGIDIFATKGIEYIFILGFLAILIFFWQALNQKAEPTSPATQTKSTSWFPLVRNLYYHQGHTWVLPRADGTALVGLDILACKLLGVAKNVEIIAKEDHLRQGKQGAMMKINGYSVPLLSPLDGKILEKNSKSFLATQEGAVNGEVQWLFKVKPDNLKANLTNLLNGELARSWRDKTEKIINSKIAGNLGLVLQDGGEISDGFIFSLPEDIREEILGAVFYTDQIKKE